MAKKTKKAPAKKAATKKTTKRSASAKKKPAAKKAKKPAKKATAKKKAAPKKAAPKKTTARKPAAKKPAAAKAAPKKAAGKRATKGKAKGKAKSLGRPRVPGDADVDLVFRSDSEVRRVCEFLGVRTLRELEQFDPDEIVARLKAPIVQTVGRIRKILAMANRSLAGDDAFAIEFRDRHAPNR